MSRKLRPLAALVLIAVVGLISACGSSTPAASGSGGNGTDAAQKAVKFAECMRHNGVSTFPDPNASGKLTIDEVANGSSLDTGSPAFKQAIGACKNLEPAGFTGSKRNSRQTAAALTFAACIRANGVRDFPDPTPNEPLVDTNRIPSSNSPQGMSILNAAMHACGARAAAAGGPR